MEAGDSLFFVRQTNDIAQQGFVCWELMKAGGTIRPRANNHIAREISKNGGGSCANKDYISMHRVQAA